jgi:hypothetical protein
MTQLDPNTRYTLTGLTFKQSRVIADALELVMRLGLGQLEYLMDFVRFGGVTSKTGEPLPYATLDEGDALVRQLKRRLTDYDDGASKGISNVHTPADAKVAFELYKAIRHRLAWDQTPIEGRDFRGVHHSDPYLLRYTDEPKVSLVQEGPKASPLDQLPAGCFLGERDGRWTVAQPADGAWNVVGEGVDAASAVAKARATLGLGELV